MIFLQNKPRPYNKTSQLFFTKSADNAAGITKWADCYKTQHNSIYVQLKYRSMNNIILNVKSICYREIIPLNAFMWCQKEIFLCWMCDDSINNSPWRDVFHLPMSIFFMLNKKSSMVALLCNQKCYTGFIVAVESFTCFSDVAKFLIQNCNKLAFTSR